jgi:hypothetical protein
MLEAVFKKTDTAIVGLPLAAGTFTVPAGKTLKVAGTVDISGVDTVINAYYGTLDVSDGGFTADSGNVFIVAQAAVAAVGAAAPGGIVPATFTNTSSDTPLSAPVVLASLKIGGTGNPTASDIAAWTASYTAYVAGDVVIDATAAADLTSAKLVVYGEIQAAGTGPLTLGTDVEGSLKATGALTLAGISSLYGLDTGTFTVTSADTAVDIDQLDSGTGGKLALSGAVTSVAIDEGNGNIELSNAGALTFASGGSFGNTGSTAFTGTAGVTVSTSEISFDGPVTFAGDLTLTGVPVTFGSSALFATGKGVKMSAEAATVTLKPGAGLGLAGASTPAWGYVLANYGTADVLLTPGTTTGLIVTGASPANRTLTQGSTPDNANHDITVTSGVASLVAGSTYVVKSASGKVGTLTVTEELRLGAGVTGSDAYDDNSAKLVLTGAGSTNGAMLKGAGTVVAGGTEIVGGTSGWQAVDVSGTAPVTIEAGAITAGSAAVALTAQDTNSAITVTASTLAVKGGITLASGKGKVILKGNGTTAGALLLKGDSTVPGLLTTDSASSNNVTVGDTTDASNFMLYPNNGSSASVTKALVTKDGTTAVASIVAKAAASDTSSGSVLGSIGGGAASPANDAVITGPVVAANASEIVYQWKVQVPNS